MAAHGRERGSLREQQADVHSTEWYGDRGLENSDLTALCFFGGVPLFCIKSKVNIIYRVDFSEFFCYNKDKIHKKKGGTMCQLTFKITMSYTLN